MSRRAWLALALAALLIAVLSHLLADAHRRLDVVERTQAGQGASVVQLDADLRRLTHEVCQLRASTDDPC